ncbi:MAG: helix-turn-helix domain-containing protein [Myxococcota bacterium]
MHTIAIACPPEVIPGDLTTPCEIFGRVRGPEGEPRYHVRVCAPTPRVDAGWFSVDVPHGLDAIEDAQTVVVPGVPQVCGPFPRELLTALVRAHDRGARIVSICTGAFVLAAAGLLGRRRATTHWAAAPALAAGHPDIEVVTEVLYVDEGAVLTSAGAAAGLDLCLYVVRCDFGASVASRAARMAVMPLERPGGQAQFVVHEPPAADEALQPLLTWIDANLTADLSIRTLSRQAATSPRTLARRFRAQLDQTPAQWVTLARVRRAQALLEETTLSIEQIAESVGFGSSATFRDRFRRIAGTSPSAWRSAFRAAPVSRPSGVLVAAGAPARAVRTRD